MTEQSIATGDSSDSASTSIVEPCVLCGATDGRAVLTKTIENPPPPRTFALLQCNTCGLVRTHPRLAADVIAPEYGQPYWGSADPANLDWVRNDQRDLTDFLSRFRTEGTILDVGCGLGLFLLALDPQRWDRYGVEPMPVPYRESAKWLGADRVFHGEITTANLQDGKFDVVTFWDSFEHLPNPRAVLHEVRRVLRPGGLVLIGLPNFGGYQARHFEQDWYHLSLPYHFFHYTAESLTKLLESCGFRIRAMQNRRVGGYHAMKHSLLARMTRRHGSRAGRLLYYLAKPFLRPWEQISARPGQGAALQICAEMVSTEPGDGPA